MRITLKGTCLKRFFSGLVIFILISTLLLPLPSITQAAEKVKIPAGTIVRLRLNTKVSPKEYKLGDSIFFTVVSDVIVEGKTVILAGASGRGEIIQAKEQNLIGIAGEIGLSVRTVQAVDGSTIILSGSKLSEGKEKVVTSVGLSLICCPLFALMKGEEAALEAGTEIDAFVVATTEVEVNANKEFKQPNYRK